MQVHTHLFNVFKIRYYRLAIKKCHLVIKDMTLLNGNACRLTWGLCMYHFLQRKVQHANTV